MRLATNNCTNFEALKIIEERVEELEAIVADLRKQLSKISYAPGEQQKEIPNPYIITTYKNAPE
ncbi:hypothetical protein [Dethiobacter alkaliphilus]|uniref:Uncharacterized protein n=1 Tax=Dethiobacter alkaliphilus AHT 1 TaxID=555088 RepID=C0GH28_DETAL|nr:hypothetical protein [Dethiobacter alkaliphilus]EEG77330.1 hypothetical protein DealDRAFT_1787 [Dethiobacter alkaliphilus AHT 1]